MNEVICDICIQPSRSSATFGIFILNTVNTYFPLTYAPPELIPEGKLDMEPFVISVKAKKNTAYKRI